MVEFDILGEEIETIEQILKDYYGDFESTFSDDSCFILRDGSVIGCSTHKTLISDLCVDLRAQLDDKYIDDIDLLEESGGEALVDLLGCIRATKVKEENYISLPKEITSAQAEKLLKWMDEDTKVSDTVFVLTTGSNLVDAEDNAFHTFNYKEETTDEILKSIKRYFTSGILGEELELEPSVGGIPLIDFIDYNKRPLLKQNLVGKEIIDTKRNKHGQIQTQSSSMLKVLWEGNKNFSIIILSYADNIKNFNVIAELKEDLEDSDFDIASKPTAEDGMVGWEQETENRKKELENCGYEVGNITKIYPRRQSSRWYEGLRIVDFRYKGFIITASASYEDVILYIKDGDEFITLYSMEELEPYGVIDDESFSRFVDDQEEDGNYNLEDYSYLYWTIHKEGTEDYYYNTDMGYDDAFDIDDLWGQLTDTHILDDTIDEILASYDEEPVEESLDLDVTPIRKLEGNILPKEANEYILNKFVTNRSLYSYLSNVNKNWKLLKRDDNCWEVIVLGIVPNTPFCLSNDQVEELSSVFGISLNEDLEDDDIEIEPSNQPFKIYNFGNHIGGILEVNDTTLKKEIFRIISNSIANQSIDIDNPIRIFDRVNFNNSTFFITLYNDTGEFKWKNYRVEEEEFKNILTLLGIESINEFHNLFDRGEINEDLDLEPSKFIPEKGKTLSSDEIGSDYPHYLMTTEQCQLLDSIAEGESYNLPDDVWGEMFRSAKNNDIWCEFFSLSHRPTEECGDIYNITIDDLSQLGIELEEIPNVDDYVAEELNEGFVDKDGNVIDIELKRVGPTKLSLYEKGNTNKPLAWVNVSNTGYIYYLETKKNYRGMGFGSIIIDKAINEMGGYWLHIERGNIRVQKWYESLGFVFVDEDEEGDNWTRLMVLKDRVNDFYALEDSCDFNMKRMLGNLGRVASEILDYEKDPSIRTVYDEKGNILKEELDDNTIVNEISNKYITDNCMKQVWIRPDGKMIGVDTSHASRIVDIYSEMGHPEPEDRFENDDAFEDYIDECFNFFCNLGWIQIGMDCKFCFICKKPTNEQYETLLKYLDYMSSFKNSSCEVDINNVRKQYSFNDTLPDEIIKNIKRYYTTGELVEDLDIEVDPTENFKTMNLVDNLWYIKLNSQKAIDTFIGLIQENNPDFDIDMTDNVIILIVDKDIVGPDEIQLKHGSSNIFERELTKKYFRQMREDPIGLLDDDKKNEDLDIEATTDELLNLPYWEDSAFPIERLKEIALDYANEPVWWTQLYNEIDDDSVDFLEFKTLDKIKDKFMSYSLKDGDIMLLIAEIPDPDGEFDDSTENVIVAKRTDNINEDLEDDDLETSSIHFPIDDLDALHDDKTPIILSDGAKEKFIKRLDSCANFSGKKPSEVLPEYINGYIWKIVPGGWEYGRDYECLITTNQEDTYSMNDDVVFSFGVDWTDLVYSDFDINEELDLDVVDGSDEIYKQGVELSREEKEDMKDELELDDEDYPNFFETPLFLKHNEEYGDNGFGDEDYFPWAIVYEDNTLFDVFTDSFASLVFSDAIEQWENLFGHKQIKEDLEEDDFDLVSTYTVGNKDIIKQKDKDKILEVLGIDINELKDVSLGAMLKKNNGITFRSWLAKDNLNRDWYFRVSWDGDLTIFGAMTETSSSGVFEIDKNCIDAFCNLVNINLVDKDSDSINEDIELEPTNMDCDVLVTTSNGDTEELNGEISPYTRIEKITWESDEGEESRCVLTGDWVDDESELDMYLWYDTKDDMDFYEVEPTRTLVKQINGIQDLIDYGKQEGFYNDWKSEGRINEDGIPYILIGGQSDVVLWGNPLKILDLSDFGHTKSFEIIREDLDDNSFDVEIVDIDNEAKLLKKYLEFYNGDVKEIVISDNVVYYIMFGVNGRVHKHFTVLDSAFKINNDGSVCRISTGDINYYDELRGGSGFIKDDIEYIKQHLDFNKVIDEFPNLEICINTLSDEWGWDYDFDEFMKDVNEENDNG